MEKGDVKTGKGRWIYVDEDTCVCTHDDEEVGKRDEVAVQ